MRASDNTSTKPRLLVVDDEPDQCAMLDMLFANDFEVVTATSVAKARTMSLDTFDMAIIDWHMPGENGMELADEVRKYLPLGRVFLYTADDVADTFEDDSWMRIPKATPPEQLLHLVGVQMRKRRFVRQKELDRLQSAEASRRPRLLIVDDEVDQCTMLKMLFESRLDVVTSASIREVLEQYDLDTFDAAIIDWHLPGESGMTLARELRRHLPAECIFLHTADPDAGGYQRGSWTHLPKSSDPEALERSVTAAAMRHKATRASARASTL